MEENKVVNEVVDVEANDNISGDVVETTDGCGSTLIGMAIGAGAFALGAFAVKKIKSAIAKHKAKKQAEEEFDDEFDDFEEIDDDVEITAIPEEETK